MLKKILPLVGMVFFCSAAHAGNTSGNVALGYQASTGNSETTNLNAKFGLKYTTGKWIDTLDLLAVKSSEDDTSTAERYDANAKAEYNLTEYNYLFDQAQYTKDLFGGIRERISDTAGYGRRLLKTERQSLDVQVGAGIRHDTTQKPELKRTLNAIGTGGLDYKLKITDSSNFTQSFKVEGGKSNVFLHSESALELRIYKKLFAQLSYTVDHNTQVPPESKRTDTYTAVKLAYKFGEEQ